MRDDAALDVIVPVRNPARLDELSRTVFSVALQDHHPVTIHVICQGFEPGQLDAIRRSLAPLITISGHAALRVTNQVPSQGLQAGCGRYAAFVDVGNLVYPEAYRLLIAELAATGSAFAVGGILNAYVCRDGLVPFTTAKRCAAQAERPGAVPLHSFVLDRQHIAPDDLAPDAFLAGMETILRRMCASHSGSVRLRDTVIGECVLDAPKRAMFRVNGGRP